VPSMRCPLLWFDHSFNLLQILGFSPAGAPILPNTANSTDPDTIRREKLGWDEISMQAAKIVSFIGPLGIDCAYHIRLY